ncbi:MAG: hypothetical protein ACODAJ_08465 [Planctomycetota bacterium]
MARRLRTEAEWLEWDVEISYHAHRRSGLRGFNEIDLRAMVEDAAGFEPSPVEGRFVLYSGLGQENWAIVVEPDDEERKLIVVTAWRV